MSNQSNFYYTSKIRVFHETPSFGPGVVSLLTNVEETGSINSACSKMNMAYSKAWKILKAAEKDLGFPLLCRITGGKGGGSSQLTPEGADLLEKYQAFFSGCQQAMEHYFFMNFHSFIPEDSFLYRKLQLPENPRIISIIGAGGKTSCMYRLAKEYASLGKKVLLTTTTHIMVPPVEQVPILLYQPVSLEQLQDSFTRSPIVALGAKDTKPGKLAAISLSFFQKALQAADVILCEADGAKMLPVKTPASHEPAIVPDSDAVIVVTGLSSYNKPLKEVCHRKEMAAKRFNLALSSPLGTKELATLIGSPEGLMKGLEDQKEKVHIFLNQADTDELKKIGEEICSLLSGQGITHLYTGSLHKDFSSSHHR